MNRHRACADLALAVFFAAVLLSARAEGASSSVQAAAGWGLGASLALACAWWEVHP